MPLPHRLAPSLLSALVLLALPVAGHAQELAGTWRLEVTAPEGSHSLTITLEVDGETVTGTTEDDEPFTGTFRDGRLTLSGPRYVDEAGYSAKLEMTGTLDGDRIRGDATWDGYVASLVGRRTG